MATLVPVDTSGMGVVASSGKAVFVIPCNGDQVLRVDPPATTDGYNYFAMNAL
jgi:hypothetical protein